MATFLKIADNEMSYFQFKAKQMLLLRKEDKEWQNFCKNVAPDCAACLSENTTSKDSKDIGIQTHSKPPAAKLERPFLQPRLQNKEIPEALNNIRTRLEKIDIALTNLYCVNSEKEQTNQQKETSILKNAHAVKSIADKRRILIQNSLKTTLENLHMSPSKTTQNKPAIQTKNSGYFLPHDLKVKREAARKAYLASLQTKPKVHLKNDIQIRKQNNQTAQNKKPIRKKAIKPGNKGVSEKKAEISKDDQEVTLISSAENEEANDQNIEYIADAILDDFLGEAALDFNKIKQKKREKEFKKRLHSNEKSASDGFPALQNSSPSKDTEPKLVATCENQSIMKLKSFFSYEKPDQSPKLKRTLSTSEAIKDTDLLLESNVKYVPKDSNIVKKNSDTFKPNQNSRVEVSPKFVCDILKTITIDDKEAKNIQQNRQRYWSYLESISRTAKGNFNPWILNRTLAEYILDDCINNITEELSIVPSSFVQDLYNEEFIQQIKK